jgi:hypothetical protein
LYAAAVGDAVDGDRHDLFMSIGWPLPDHPDINLVAK